MTNEDQLVTALVGTIGDAVLILDAAGQVAAVSAAFAQRLGREPSTLIGQPAEALATTEADGEADGEAAGEAGGVPGLSQALAAAAEAPWSGSFVLPGPGGRPLALRGRIATVRETGGMIVVLDRNPSDLTHDPLTGLPNRTLLEDRLAQALTATQRSGKPLAVMVIGIDRFGLFASGMGRSAADQVLVQIAERVRASVRTSDTVARFDNDRFAAILPVAQQEDGAVVANKIIAAARLPIQLPDRSDTRATLSIGLSLAPEDGREARQLLSHAEEALEAARSGGGDRLEFYRQELNARARRRLDLEGALRRAIQNQEFIVYYQPKIDVDSDQVAGMETLIRWLHPERGLISPGDFIPVAEETGLIVEIGAWILRETCRQVKAWQDAGLPKVKASVNVSGRQFASKSLVPMIRQILDETGLDPRWLELELTESILMGDVEAIIERLEALRALGVDLSIDDFGTGYSSLSYLNRFPITTLKIDRAFVHGVEVDERTAEIARAIIGLSQGLRLQVVAEGAETAAHVQFLRDHGCKVVQGYYYSRPLPASEFEAMLRDRGRGS